MPPAPPRKPKERMTVSGFVRGALMDNLGLKFVAFVLALTVFILVHSDEDAVAGAYVDISYQMPSDRVLVSQRLDQVRITVKGSWRRVKRFDESSVDPIRIDVRNFKTGDFIFKPDMFRLPPGLEVQSIDPPTMALQFEPLARKQVPVVAATRGHPSRGFGVAQLTARRAGCAPEAIDCDAVTIEGAEAEVLRTEEVRTEELSLTGRTSSFRERVDLVPPSSNVWVVGKGQVEVAVTVVEELTMRDLGEVPIAIRPGADVDPEVAGNFTTDPIVVGVVLRGGRLAVEQVLPSQVQAFVKVYSADVASKRPRPAPVVFEGVPEGVAVELAPREVTLQTRSN